ncbi:MAG TPA: hypothetical protein VFR31_04910 [Thermoanaerobaculia bacterium]|nr:hypothetical protein [Thermoanaerobaculia bacterium]
MSGTFASYIEKARQLQTAGASDEELLRILRQEGASMMESVKLMRELKSVSLREAQDIVHLSDTWADHKESHEQLQETFAEALRKLANETDSSGDG